MRALLLLLAACDPYPEADPNAVDDAPTVDQCSETYTIPGTLGTLLTEAVEPHQLVFGSPEPIGGPSSPSVGPDPVHVHIGWPGRDTSTSVSFVWSTDRGTLSSLVEWGKEGEEPTLTEGVSYTYGGADQHQFRVHELKLCGRLEPGTTYTYRVGGDGHWSPTYTFRTPGAPGTFDTFVVAIAGDSRGAYEDWARVVDAMAAYNPDLYLFSGDMVQFGTSQDEWFSWWEGTNDRFAEAFFVPAHGNHEFLATNYFALFSLPNNEQWFSIDYGSLSVASLNDTVSQRAFVEFDEASFVADKLGASTAPWKIVMHHQPVFSTCTRHGSNLELRDQWQPVFDEVGADLVLAGHNHIYERSVPIRAGAEVAPDAGTTYLVSGGAGASLYPESEAEWFNEVANPIEHYIIGEFSATEAVFTVRDLAGNVLDTFTLPVSP